MEEKQGGSLARFRRRFRHSRVRWIVLVHGVLLGTLITLITLAPRFDLPWQADAALVLAQVALLLIWMTLSGGRASSTDRMVWTTCALLAVHIAHTPVVGSIQWVLSLVCMVPFLFVMLGVVALPLTIAASRGFLIVRFRHEAMPKAGRLQFSVRSVVVAAVCVAVLFSLKGIVVGLSESPESIILGIVTPFAAITMVLVIPGIYLSIPLVAVWAVLSPGTVVPRLAAALVAWAMGGVLVFHYLQTGDGPLRVAIPTSVAGVTVGAVLILLATLFVLRAMGYRAVQVDGEGWILLNDPEPAPTFDEPDPFVENDV